MDGKTFDQIAVRVADGTRRGLLRRIAGFSLGWGALAVLSEVSEARGNHKHDKKKKKRKKNKKNPGASCFCGTNQTCVDGECVLCDVCSRDCPFASVQQAVNAAEPGSTIRICGGFFRPVTITKNLTLLGAGTQVGGTALRGEGATRVVTVGSGVSVALVDLAIDGGFDSGDGGGCLNQGTLKLINCLVSTNQAQRGGGIFNTSGSSLTLQNTTVTENAASTDGGGIFNDTSGSVTLTSGSSVSGNMPNNCAGDPVPGCSA
jgi:hypothetical protein